WSHVAGPVLDRTERSEEQVVLDMAEETREPPRRAQRLEPPPEVDRETHERRGGRPEPPGGERVERSLPDRADGARMPDDLRLVVVLVAEEDQPLAERARGEQAFQIGIRVHVRIEDHHALEPPRPPVHRISVDEPDAYQDVPRGPLIIGGTR